MNKLFSTIILLSLLLSSNAYAKCVQGNCVNGQGTLVSHDRTYVGDFKNDRKYGQGTETYNNGSKYVGEFKNDKIHGQGTKRYVINGEYIATYVGEWKNDLRDGIGTIIYPDGSKITGEYKKGKKVKRK